MSRLFGCMCNEPERLTCVLHPAREALVAASAPDGWGLAFFQGGEPLLQRHPKPVTHLLDFYAAVTDLRTDFVVGHVRDRGPKPKLENTQPFRFRTWVFAHSGFVPHFESIQAGVLEHVPDFLRRNVRGQTDSEHVFHLFLAFLHDAGKLDDPNVKAEDAARALRQTVAMIEQLARPAGDEPVTANVVVANGRMFLASRRGRPMWLRRLRGLYDCQVCCDNEAVSRSGAERRRIAHDHLRAVLAVSEPPRLGPEGWEELPDGSILAVARDLSTKIFPLGV